MKLTEILLENQTEIINEAFNLLQRSQLKHYNSSPADENWQRLASFYSISH